MPAHRKHRLEPGDRKCRLLVLEVFYDREKGVLRCRCLCDCGTEKVIQVDNICRGATRSCGCYGREVTAAWDTIHAMFGTPTYRAWGNMRRRCREKSGISWPHYGARGITVCPEWDRSFRVFFEDMGLRPDGMSLDRIDVNKGYFKANCRWANRHEQGRNRTDNRFLESGGERLTITEWAERLGTQQPTISMRLKMGWTVERAVTQPVQRRRNP